MRQRDRVTSQNVQLLLISKKIYQTPQCCVHFECFYQLTNVFAVKKVACLMCVLFGQALKRGQLARHVAAKLHFTAAQSIIRMHSCSGMTPFPRVSQYPVGRISKRACDRTTLL